MTINVDYIFSDLSQLCGVTIHKPIERGKVDAFSHSFRYLPDEHVEFLAKCDGIEIYDGYFRLFGISSSATMNLVSWNSSELWKFAWPQLADDFFFFGETAFGDQYAYSKKSSTRSGDREVYFLDAYAMTPEVIAPSFIDFMGGEYLRNASSPYDDMIIKARKRLGVLPLEKHVTYVPSPLITGVEDNGALEIIDAVASMVINGDLHRQLVLGPSGQQIKELRSYIDDLGRGRLAVVWW